MYMYMFCAFWCEAMLLVVNIVTCPIGTDCGGSVSLYPWLVYIDNQGLQRAFCLHVAAKHISAILNVT